MTPPAAASLAFSSPPTDLERRPPETLPGPREAAILELLLPSGPVSLGFVAEGDTIHLVARERSARWAITVLREGAARLRVTGGIVDGSARLVIDPDEKLRVLDLFRTKYGDPQFERWYEHPARILRVDVRPGTTSAFGDPARYYEWLSDEFDNVADDYDRHITGNRINVLLRDRSLAELRHSFARSPSLLEIGCGSGMETLPLLEDGHEMLCVDISSRMLETVRTKARAAGVSERLQTRHLRASELGRLLREVGPARFDGGYSTYGALNCEADLSGIPSALHSLLRPRAMFVAGVYNRWCLFEVLGYALSGQPARAFGRTHRPVPVGSSRFCVDIYAHSTSDFRRLFSPWFRVDRVEAIPVLLPPSDLVGYAEKFARHFDRLARWDRSWGARWPLRELGDHFLMTFAREDLSTSSPSAR